MSTLSIASEGCWSIAPCLCVGSARQIRQKWSDLDRFLTCGGGNPSFKWSSLPTTGHCVRDSQVTSAGQERGERRDSIALRAAQLVHSASPSKKAQIHASSTHHLRSRQHGKCNYCLDLAVSSGGQRKKKVVNADLFLYVQGAKAALRKEKLAAANSKGPTSQLKVVSLAAAAQLKLQRRFWKR